MAVIPADTDPAEPGDALGQDDAAPLASTASPDVADAMRLLLWARRQGFEIPVIRIGQVQLQAKDLRPIYGRSGGGPPGPRTIWEENGVAPEDLEPVG